MSRALGLALPFVLLACGSPSADDGDSGSSSTGADESESSAATTIASTSTSTSTSTTGSPADPDAMCMHWLAEREDLTEGSWTGDVASCNAGDIDIGARGRTLRVLNLYRWLAELPAITLDETRNAKAQECALMMHASNTLSHTPTPDWPCYTMDGAEAAGSSNIATGPAVASIDLYMMDPGNPDTIGHRRWILSNSIGPTGVGSTDSYSCLWTIGGSGVADAPWIAYPTPGAFPLAATDLGWTNLDMTGWSIQSDTIDLSTAQVEITRAGETLPVMLHPLGAGYGSMFAVSILPSGWQTTVGSYHVRVTGVAQPIEYDVEIVDCGG
ncbi:MAG TPA: CAP domain-containing protein [Nannocystaceae bacterium]|nr:CAP domain-containing protein [Nannocystaceae bacterium]